jgi:hypothetical protein
VHIASFCGAVLNLIKIVQLPKERKWSWKHFETIQQLLIAFGGALLFFLLIPGVYTILGKLSNFKSSQSFFSTEVDYFKKVTYLADNVAEKGIK